MSTDVLFQLIRNSASAIALTKENGDIVLTSDKFQNIVANNLPFENNILDMFMHAPEINYNLLDLRNKGAIGIDFTPIKIKISEVKEVTLTLQSKFESNKEYLLLLQLNEDKDDDDNIIKKYLSSDNLFINSVRPSLVYSEIESKILGINNSGKNIYDNYISNYPEQVQFFEDTIEELISKAKVGGLSSKECILNSTANRVFLSFECTSIDTTNEYFIIYFDDVSTDKRKDEILMLEKERLHNLVQVVPGVLFEFEIRNSALNFTFVSQGIKDIIGLSAEHITKDSNLLFSRFDRIERARLHYLFTSASEESRKVRNEYRIKDKEESPKWVTIDWHETSVSDDVIKGAGYLMDISDKKKAQRDQKENERKKILVDYFSMVMLRNYSTTTMLEDLAKTIVKKLNLQDVIIYLYNSDSHVLEYGASYSEFIQGSGLNHFPKTVSCEKGIIGRVVKRQVAELVNNSSEDSDYYFFDRKAGSEITVPIIFEGELLGIIDTEHININAFTNFHLDVLENISNDLGIRLVQKKRQKENYNYKQSLDSIYQEGKIFNFEFDLVKRKLNNYCVDSLISLIDVTDKDQKIKIYENPNILFDYIADYDRHLFDEFVSSLNTRDANNSITIRVNSTKNEVKWLKISVIRMKTKISDIVSIFGTMQDVTEYRILEQRSRGYESLIECINLAQLELERDSDFKKSLGIVASSLGVSRAVVSLFNEDKNNDLHLDDLVRWVSDKADYKGKDITYLNIFENFNLYDTLHNKYYFDLSELHFNEEQKEFINSINITSLIGFPMKTPSGLKGVIYFIEEHEERKWLDYEKTLLSTFSNFLALKYQNLSLIHGESLKNLNVSSN